MRTSRIFYGWWLVAAVFVMLACTGGLVFYPLTVFLRALTVEQGFDITSVSGATAVFFVVSGVGGPPIAALLHRWDARLVVMSGAAVATVAIAALAMVTQVWQLYAVYAALGLGFAAAGLVPGTTLVTRWFARRRAAALSVASTGLSAGGVVFTPVLAGFVERHGIVAVAPWLAVTFLVAITPLTLLFVRSDPSSRGLAPDGDPVLAASGLASGPASGRSGTSDMGGEPASAAGDSGMASAMTVAEATRTPFYRAVTGAHLLGMLAQVGGLAHLYNLVADRLDAGTAALAVSTVAMSSLVGRLVGGALLSSWSLRGFTLANLGVQAAALVLLAVGGGTAALLAATVLFGFTVGNLLMLHPLLLADAFGASDYARIYTRSTLVATVGIAAGPALLGVLRGALDSYVVAFLVGAMSSLAAAALLSTRAGRPTGRSGRGAGPAAARPAAGCIEPG